MHYPPEVKEGIDECIGKLYDESIFSVRIDDRMHLHGPYEHEVIGHELVCTLAYGVDILFAGTYHDDLTV